MPMSKFFMMGALASAAAAVFVALRRQAERSGAIKDMVDRRDWESPVPPATRVPSPEKVAEDVTGIPPAVNDALRK